MGHYCRICGRTRSNEKFSGKGHKNHVCKDCSGKSSKKAKKSTFTEDAQTVENLMSLDNVLIQSEENYFEYFWFYEGDLEIEAGDEDDEDLPF